MKFRVRLRGRGRVELAAYGLADAEHQVEKELLRLWPDARVGIVELRRSGAKGRIAEIFEVEYRLEGSLEVEAASDEGATRAALRRGRDRLTGSRYWEVAWERVEVSEDG